jgi:hypothetical protein
MLFPVEPFQGSESGQCVNPNREKALRKIEYGKSIGLFAMVMGIFAQLLGFF